MSAAKVHNQLHQLSALEARPPQKSSPFHCYRTRYSLKFSAKENNLSCSDSAPNLSQYSISSSSRTESVDFFRCDPNSVTLSDCVSNTTESTRADGILVCRLCSREMIKSVTGARLLIPWKPLAFMVVLVSMAVAFALLCDKTVGELKYDVDSIMMEVRIMQIKMDDLARELSAVINANLRNHLESSQDKVQSYVKNELQQYDADKTGMTDYALESAGGQIVSTRDTLPYQDNVSLISFLFGITSCAPKNGARAVIQPNSMPGECWAFKGHEGRVVIKLLYKIYITGVSMEHISSSIAPNGETYSAPKDFSVWGLTSLNSETEEFLFGKFRYDAGGPPLQYFAVHQEASQPYPMLELKIESNHGSEDYTCVYRFRVHGHAGHGSIKKVEHFS